MSWGGGGGLRTTPCAFEITNSVFTAITMAMVIINIVEAPSWFPTTATIYCMLLSIKAELTAAAIFETQSNVCPTLPVTSGDTGFLGPLYWH